MSQSVNLSVAGIYTAPSDLAGSPPGSLDVANNVESRYRNLLEPRRGFDSLTNSAIAATNFVRLVNFPVDGAERIIALTDLGEVLWYDAVALDWFAIPGLSTNINPINRLAKSRFVRGAQNLYLTTLSGVLSMASASGSNMLRAGVPVGLDLLASTTSDRTGFFSTNDLTSTTGAITNASNQLRDIGDTSGIAVGQFVGGFDITAAVTIQDISYAAVPFGAAGNAITVRYVNSGVSLPLAVSFVASAITVQLQTDGAGIPVSVASAILTIILTTGLVTGVANVPGAVQAVQAVTSLSGGLDTTIPSGTTIGLITPAATVISQLGTTTAGSANLTALASNAGIVAGLKVVGTGIPDGTTVVSISGAGPYTVVLSGSAFLSATTNYFTFSTPILVTMSAAALYTATVPISFYSGSQVAYRMVFGRIETDIQGNSTTRIGAPSAMAIATNVSPYATNVTVTGTLPKNSSAELTLVQLYRSQQTDTIAIVPLDQMQLVYERDLVGADFSNRTLTIVDETPDSLMGIPLYTGADREGIGQANTPPPGCWDMCIFRDFALYFNTTQPSTIDFTILAVGAPSGLQSGDAITITTSTGQTAIFSATGVENPVVGNFKVFTSGTPSQNITDTANSLIRVINYEDNIAVHAILTSSTTDLPGQIFLQSDYPQGTFTVSANAHTSAYDPVLSGVPSEVNSNSNFVSVSKSGEIEAVPVLNSLAVGDSSSPIYRGIALRDYVFIIKGNGIYKIVGNTPGGLTVLPFDLTTKIIGPDAAVSLNSGVWMLSNQGVVSISDAGVSAISTPLDNQLNELTGTNLDNVHENAFAIGYESDRKYILSVPTNTVDDFGALQYNFNYVTNSWTTWNRKLRTGFIHSEEDKMYISRADALQRGLSKERKTGTYIDYVDEAITESILTVVSSTVVTVVDINNVEAGDILYQNATTLSPVASVDLAAGTVITQFGMSWAIGAVEVLKAYECAITWKQIFGDNPAFTRQFTEGLALFKNTRFNSASMTFKTDFSQSLSTVALTGQLLGSWGLFPWGSVPWGGLVAPSSIRFLVPTSKQYASYLSPTLKIKQGWSNFKLQGLSISYHNISEEVGK